MNKALPFFLALILGAVQTEAQVFWTDNFESTSPSSGTRSAPNHANTTDGSDTNICGLGNYFFRTTDAGGPGNPFGLDVQFTNIEGSTYWRAEDLDACITNPDRIDFTGIDISGRTGVAFKGLFGVREGNIRFEADDNIKVFYQLDGGGYVLALAFESDLASGTVGNMAQDTNFDGFGDGTLLSQALTEFTFTIPSTGNNLDFRIEYDIDGPGEEIAIDFFRAEEVVLPVELVLFQAKSQDHHILLEWQTASEENNHYFQIERSRDGKNFSAIDKVMGQGTSSKIIHYSIIDNNPNTGTNYYRLKQVDYDATFEYSEMISASMEMDYDLLISPNPFNESITLNRANLKNEHQASLNLQIKMYDLFGRTIFTENMNRRDVKKSLNLSHLHSGTYTIILSDENNLIKTQRIIKR